jgi:predicted P-loop ATPase
MGMVSKKVKMYLNGDIEVADRSEAITLVAKELYGWENYFKAEGFEISADEDVDYFIYNFAKKIGAVDKLDRILSTIDREKCVTSKELVVGDVWVPTHLTVEANVEEFIRRTAHRFRYNSLTQQLEFDGSVKDTKEAAIALREQMNCITTKPKAVKIKMRDFEDMVMNYAVVNRSYNPIAEYLNDLRSHSDDLITPLAQKMGLTEFEKELLTVWLLQSYHRPLNVGCDAPFMLILVGSQGCGKTSLLRILSKGWMVDLNLRNSNGKDGMILLHKGWFVNNDELSTMDRNGIESLKAEVTSTKDTYRPPYSAITHTLLRHSVFCGTTNQPNILKDDSGNRRFLPIHFRNTFSDEDRMWLEANVDRLWGYVKFLAESGAKRYLSPNQMKELSNHQSDYQLRSHSDDVLLGIMLWWHQNQTDKPLSASLIGRCLSLHKERMSSQKIGQRLVAIGFQTEQKKVSKLNIRAISNLDHILSFDDVTPYDCTNVMLTE